MRGKGAGGRPTGVTGRPSVSSAGDHKPPPVTDAIAHWLAGLFLAALLSVTAVVIAHDDHLGPLTSLRWIERWGVDTTMRLYGRIFGGEAIGTEKDQDLRPPAPPGYVFIDLDADTCRAGGLRGDPGDPCGRRSAASPGAAARVANALIEQTGSAKPRLIVLDVRLWDSNPDGPVSKDVAQLLINAARPGTPPILAASPTSPLSPEESLKLAPGAPNDPRRVFVDWSMVPACIRNSEIRFAPALLWPDAPDGVARRYPLAANVRVFKVAGGPVERTGDPAKDCQPPAVDANALDAATTEDGEAATLPYLAALYAGRPDTAREQVRCASVGEAWRGGTGVCAALADAHPKTDAGHGKPRTPDAAGAPPPDEKLPRTFFTIGAQGNEDLEAVGRYSQHAASQVVNKDGVLLLDRDLFRDRIVVVGYSGAIGMDRHATPIGEMAGAQVILNAIRSFITGTVLGGEPIEKTALRELKMAAVSSVPFLPFWLGAVFAGRWAAKRPVLVRAGVGVGVFLFFVLTATVSATLTLNVVAWFHARDLAQGKPIDALLPLLVLMLECFVHAAAHLIEVVHTGAVKVIEFVKARLPIHSRETP
jgi:hypothetical protein